DSRVFHCDNPCHADIVEAQRIKPRLPVHAVMPANAPIIRFICGDDPQANLRWIQSWLKRLPLWSQAGQPWLFINTPEVGIAPEM
ncbi:hypothetical protein LXA55_18255, partial [Erwinia amylovora]|nr:hypothetical protein [Erwinia amylovora]